MAPVINYQSNIELTHVKGDYVCLKKRSDVTHVVLFTNGTVKAVCVCVYIYENIYSTATINHGRNHRLTRVIKHAEHRKCKGKKIKVHLNRQSSRSVVVYTLTLETQDQPGVPQDSVWS